MTAMGHTRSFGDVGSMSGLPPIADIARQFLEQVGGGQSAKEPILTGR
jgi:hypothetical protein